MIVDSLAPYLTWAKMRPRAGLDLAASNLLACTIDELPGARDALQLAARNDDGYPPLLEAVAARYGVGSDAVATATGASGANFLVLATLLSPGDEVAIERPGYDPLVGAARLLGARVTSFERRFEDGYRLDPEAVARVVTERTRLVAVTNLHNPSGALAGPADLEAVGQVATRARARVLVDEVYLDTTLHGQATSAARLSGPFVVTSSLTKSYGLAGLRCGWAIAPPDVIARIRRARDLVDGTGAVPAETLATLAFAHLESLAARARAILEPNLRRMHEWIASQPALSWQPPAGGTVAFPRVAGLDDTAPFALRLLERHDTAIVPGRYFDAPAHFRVSFGCREDVLARGLAHVARALAEELAAR